MRTFGSADSKSAEDARLELRVLRGSDQVLLIYPDKWKKLQIRASVHGVAFCEVTLCAHPAEVPEVVVGAILEAWAPSRNEQPMHMVARTRIDFVHGEHAEGGEPTLNIQSRSPSAALFDAPSQMAFSGELSKLIERIVSAQGVSTAVSVPAGLLSCWVNASSAYGALRLIGLSLNFVVQPQKDGSLRVVDLARAQSEASARPIRNLAPEDIKSYAFQHGVPVKPPQR